MLTSAQQHSRVHVCSPSATSSGQFCVFTNIQTKSTQKTCLKRFTDLCLNAPESYYPTQNLSPFCVHPTILSYIIFIHLKPCHPPLGIMSCTFYFGCSMSPVALQFELLFIKLGDLATVRPQTQLHAKVSKTHMGRVIAAPVTVLLSPTPLLSYRMVFCMALFAQGTVGFWDSLHILHAFACSDRVVVAVLCAKSLDTLYRRTLFTL